MPCSDKVHAFLTQAFFSSKHMESEKNTSGDRRSKLDGLRRQEVPVTTTPAIATSDGRHLVAIEMGGDAYALLAAMAVHDGHGTVERAVRAAIARDVQAFTQSIDEAAALALFEADSNEEVRS